MKTDPDTRRRELAIALVSAAVILLQITLTRILSVLLWYHCAFFTISLAMLGIGAPGVWLSFVKRRDRFLVPSLLTAALLVPAGIIAILRVSRPLGATPIVAYFACLLPAALALGAAVCILLLDAGNRNIARMYAADLVGASAGAIIVIPLLRSFPTPELAAAIGLLPLAAAWLVGGRRTPIAVIGALLLVGLFVREPFRVRFTKAYEETGPMTPIWERWTPTARLAVFDHVFWVPDPAAPFGWGMGDVPPASPPVEQYWLEQDGSAGTPITRFDGVLGRLSYLFHDVTSIGYQLRPPRRVAIVGTGGGRDILCARLAGADHIDAVELNGGIVEALRTRFRQFSGGVYDLPGVRGIVGEGRSVLTRSDGRYDLIQISLTDSWAATAAGAFSLSENNLYTLEAFRLYWSRLDEDGMLAVSRWNIGGFGMELPRLLFLAQAALRSEGIGPVREQIAVAQGGQVATLLLSKTPFTDAEKSRLLAIAGERGFGVLLPVSNLPPEERRMIEQLSEAGPPAFLEQGLHLEPPTDDRPFFFQTLSPFEHPSALTVQRNGANAEAVVTLRHLMFVMSAVALALFFIPFVLGRRLERSDNFWAGSLFFACIGVAFMLVEVAWVQRFILYLGHPSRAAAAVLGCMLLGAGIGSSAATRLGAQRARRRGLLVPAWIAAVNGALALVFPATIGWSAMARLFVTILAVLPSGFLMGFFFPLGMLRFGERSRAWYWAVNGATSVVASVMALALSMQFGFARVGFLAAACYVAAWAVYTTRRAPATDT